MNQRVELNASKPIKRRLFIVDIENAVGSGRLTEESVKAAMLRVTADHNLENGELVVLGVSYSNNLFPARAWRGATLVYQRGKDGADYSLKRVINTENVANRFQEVVLVSGDGIFTEEVEMLKAQGVRVVVDSCVRSISSQLAKCASIVCFADAHAQIRAFPAAA